MIGRYVVHKLHCSGCAVRIEEALVQLPGVCLASIDLDARQLRVEGEQPPLETLCRVADAIEPGAYFEELPASDDTTSLTPPPSLLRTEPELWIAALLFACGLVFGDWVAGTLEGESGWLAHGVRFGVDACFFGIPYVLCGFPVLRKAFLSIRSTDFFNEYTLMSGATLAAAALGEFPEAVGVMLFYCIGEAVQERAAGRSRRSIKALLAARPTIAHLLTADTLRDVVPESLRPGMRILVKPGEKIPLDGVVLSGSSQVDTSPLTGEAVPVRVSTDAKVFAGTVNLAGALTVEVTALYENSSVARVLELVERATANKAPVERFITRFARYYTPAVVLAAVLVAVGAPLLGLGSFHEWGYRALVLLVVSCPCALIISIPLGYLEGSVRPRGGVFWSRAGRCSTRSATSRPWLLTKPEPSPRACLK
ncbi:MAG: heavy metal translocating P-type ATPase [Bilophila sp.]